MTAETYLLTTLGCAYISVYIGRCTDQGISLSNSTPSGGVPDIRRLLIGGRQAGWRAGWMAWGELA